MGYSFKHGGLMMFRLYCYCLLILTITVSAIALPAPLQTFTVKDYLQHQWSDELVHFPITYTGKLPKSLTLIDADGKSIPGQFNGLARKHGKVTGTAWTVVTLPPKGQATFYLQPGTPAQTALRLLPREQDYVLSNECLAVRLPRFTGALAQPVDITALPAPLLAVSGPEGKTWLGQGAWVNDDTPLQVKTATTTILEEGPVRVTVRYRLVFTDDRYYQADITLGDRQDAVLFTDDTNIEAPKAAFRFSFQQGLGADRIYWRNNYFADPAKGLTLGPIDFTKEQVICNMRPWAFWWLKDRATCAGVYKDGADPFVGILAIHASRWSPYGWDGFDHTEMPITARPGGQLDLTLALLARTQRKIDYAKLSYVDQVAADYSYATLSGLQKKPGDIPVLVPLHRELAFTVGAVADYVIKGDTKPRMRRQLIKYSEFPLDEVKDYGFGFKAKSPARKHPFLLFTPADVERARRQAKTVPVFKAEMTRVTNYYAACGGVDNMVAKIEKSPDGWLNFYRDHYVGNYFYINAPTAYLGSDDPRYGKMLAAGVKGLARENMDMFLESPGVPTLANNGHLGGTRLLQLLLAYDTLADSAYLTAEEKQDIESVLLFGSYVLAHPDYWNNDRGLCSANPNMTSLLRLPLGLQALFLEGHPQSAHWLKYSEAELRRELKDWVAPGGAWIECPGYQGASLDGVFLLAQALKNVKNEDYFADPQFKATMEYYGFLLTPPDKRFPPVNPSNLPAPMILPAIGDMWTGSITAFNGWMAKSTAASDPAYSARQQFYWKAQNTATLASAFRAGGYTFALVDAELPSALPGELSRPFPGFGSILRTSWTDPNASYVAHRGGNWPTLGHWHYDFNEIVFFTKGAPVCGDFGNLYAPKQRCEPFYHNTVSYDLDKTSRSGRWGNTEVTDGPVLEVRTLPHAIDYSTGYSKGDGGQRNTRHLLLVKSANPLGANYLVVRDVTVDGQPNQEFFWNLWCFASEPEITGNVVHFPGQFGVDLDVHVLSPAMPQYEKDHWNWKEQIGTWGWFAEDQSGIHVRKQGSTEDFFTVLYPRAAGQGPAQVTTLANGAAARVAHMEGTDVVLLSPGKATTVTDGDVSLTGEIAFARRYANGTLRLAVLKGKCTAILGEWMLTSDGPVAIEVQGKVITGESNGGYPATIHLPDDAQIAKVTLDGKPCSWRMSWNTVGLNLPDGVHKFTIALK